MKTWFPAFLIAVFLPLIPGFAGAQQLEKIPRIGFLSEGFPSSSIFLSFQQGVRELGYIEGQNIIIEPRFAHGNGWRLNDLAAELVRLKVNVIVVQSSSALSAAIIYTKTIPIVMAYTGDPVAAGIIASLERPGGNVTGIGGLAAGLGGKWLELLKQTVPEVSRVGVLYTRISERESPMMKEVEVAAHSLRVELQPVPVLGASPQANTAPSEAASSSNVGAAFTWAMRGRADGLIVLPALVFGQNPGYIADLALQRRIPAIFWRADFAEAGGLMAYATKQVEQFRRAAYFVDKILKGANPAELPVELPKNFELVINLKTAKEIGITIPPRVLAWADRVIK